MKFVVLAEEQAFAYADFAAGTNQTFPIVGIGGELAGQQNFDASVENTSGRGIVRTERASADAFAAAIEPGCKDAGVIEDQQISGLQEIWKIAEQAIGIVAAGALQVQHAGAVASGERGLGDEFAGQMEVEVGNQHGVRL